MNEENKPAAYRLEPLPAWREYPAGEMCERARWFYRDIARRRTVREFDSRPVPKEVIDQCLLAAGTAPSGANQQPWHFVVITDPTRKRRIREAAEAEEAPVLIAIFAQKYGLNPDGSRYSHYYFPESVGIATGFLIAALHHAGLATLTHTPNPMRFLNEICGRPTLERPTILLVAGYPKPGCQVPLHGGIKKPLEDISTWI